MKDEDFDILVRSACRTGAKMAGFARRLGNSSALSDTLSAHQILNGYILRAVQCDTWYNVTIIDPPSYVWLPGSISSNADNAEAINVCVPVGPRDDLVTPGTEAEHEVLDKTWMKLVAPVQPDDLPAENAVRYFHMQPQVDGYYRTIGSMRIPMKTAFSPTLDSEAVLSFDEEVQVGMACVVPKDVLAGISTVQGDYPQNLGVLGSFWVGESQLPSGWRFLIRRMISSDYYADKLNSRLYGTNMEAYYKMPGGAAIMAEGDEKVDRYCIAVECVNQYKGTFQSGSPVVNFYDMQGEHELFIMQAEINREDYVPGNQLLATRTTTLRVGFADIPLSDYRPYPVVIGSAVGNRPPLPMPVWWATPKVARSQEGFTVFVHYTAANNRLHLEVSTEEASAESLHWGYIIDENNNRAMWAIVVITPDGGKHILRGDVDRTFPWNVLETAVPDFVVYPWIVGAFSVSRTTEEPVPETVHTAYALVWEDHWDVFGNPNPLPDDNGMGNPRFFLGSNTIGGEWALYAVKDGPPTRTIIPSEWATAFKPMLGGKLGPAYLPGFKGNYQISPQWPNRQMGATHTSAYYAGDEKIVTAVISNAYHAVYADFDPAEQGSMPFRSRPNKVDPHDVHCGVLDMRTNTVEARGVIFTRDNMDLYCHITVVQEFGPTIDDVPGEPAVLLASVFDVSVSTNQIQLSTPNTKVYISIDGGWTWRPYITDQSGPNGAFAVGNRFWRLDPSIPLDKDFK